MRERSWVGERVEISLPRTKDFRITREDVGGKEDEESRYHRKGDSGRNV